MFIYDEQHMKKIWLKTKRKLDLDKANRKRKVLKLTPEFTPELKEFSYEDIDTKLGELARDYYSIMRGETEDEYNS